MYDICIIGAGIVGTAIAQRLSRYELNIVVLEKHNDVACGATKANSALIHAGFDAPRDTLMSQLNIRGNSLYDQLCEDLSIPFDRNGALVLAKTNEEIGVLKALKENGDKAGVSGLEILSKKQVESIEPNLNEQIVAGLYAPSAGIINPWEAAIAFVENAMDNGTVLKREFEVNRISFEKGIFEVVSKNEEKIEAKMVINASGISGDDIYGLIEQSHFKILPRKGEYFLLDQVARNIVNKTIFGCPSSMGKGVVISPTVDGNVLVGPTSENMPLHLKEDTATSYLGLESIMSKGKELVKDLPFHLNITNYAGVRAEPSTHDFIIEPARNYDKFINVVGIKSPGLSSAPAIAEYVEKMISEIGIDLRNKKNYIGKRHKKKFIKEMNLQERNEMIQDNPLYGRIICRCEEISEGEIIDAIHQTCGARSLNAVKRRTRPGAGRCQGGFCGPKVVEILSRELGTDRLEVVLEEEGSIVLKYETKPLKEGSCE